MMMEGAEVKFEVDVRLAQYMLASGSPLFPAMSLVLLISRPSHSTHITSFYLKVLSDHGYQ
jgi:hypothetical protein